MSENILKFIPTDPNYIPDMVAQKMARDTLMSFAPQADGVTANVTDKVQFVDQGGNFQQVSCPICGANLSMSWWNQVAKNLGTLLTLSLAPARNNILRAVLSFWNNPANV